MNRRALVAAAVLAVALAGCSGADRTGSPSPGPPSRSSAPGPSPSAAAGSLSAGGSDGSSADSATAPGADAGSGDSAGSGRVRPVQGPLSWERVPGSVASTVIRGGRWTLTVNRNRTVARLDGPHARTIRPSGRFRVNETFLDGDYAVVVAQDRLEKLPSVATVVDLARGREYVVNGAASVPTVSGGTWAMGDGTLVHATARGGRYCLATVRLADGAARVPWCAPRRHGFSNAAITPAGTTLMSFDDGRPQCRTLGRLTGGSLSPVVGPVRCTGWEAALTAGGTVWSVIPQENRIDAARFAARLGHRSYELGAGDSGSLVACDGAAYFTQESQRDGTPARLLRWTDRGVLEVVYRTPGSPGLLSEPRCGGDRITITALSEGGDEQVTALVR